MLPSIRPFVARSTRRSRRLLWLLAVIALAATACGGDDDTVAVEDAATDDVATTDEDADDGDSAQAPEAGESDADDAVEPATEDTAEQADEVDDDGEHRPSEALRSTIDCSTVATSGVGATILFPDSNDPASLQAGPGPVTVEVVGCSDTFEANVQYDAFHGQDTTPTLSGFTQGGTLGSWEEFSFEETYWTPGDWTVVVFVDDAESGNRVEYDQVTFTVD